MKSEVPVNFKGIVNELLTIQTDHDVSRKLYIISPEFDCSEQTIFGLDRRHPVFPLIP